jgi:hypothetical protein
MFSQMYSFFYLNGKKYVMNMYYYNNNFVALVRDRTIPTERPSLLGEVSANFCGEMGVADKYVLFL